MNSKTRERLLEHCKEVYASQLEERNKIDSQIGFCLAVMGLIANGCIAYLGEPPTAPKLVVILFYCLLGGSFVCGLIALSFFLPTLGFIRSNKHHVLESPRKLVALIKEQDAKIKTPAENTMLADAFDERLIELYADAATFNAAEFERRKGLIRRVVFWSALSFIFLFLNALPFFYAKISTTKSPTEIKIVNPIKVDYDNPK